MTTAPEPFVPAGTDLRSLQSMFLDVVALQNSDTWAMADGWQSKACVNLWMRAWHQVPAGSLPNDERVLAGWAGVPDWSHVREIAMRGFVLCSDGRLYHRTICDRVLDVIASSTKRSAAAKARWGKENVHDAMHMQVQCHRDRDRDRDSKNLNDQKGLDLGTELGPNAWPKDYQEQFWSEYPRKIAKAAAMRSLAKFKDRVPWSLIMAKVKAYKIWLSQGSAKNFRPDAKHPATWINGEGWNDDYGDTPPPTGPVTLDRVGWERVKRVFESTHRWPGPGPAPGQPGCLAPKDLFPRPG